MASPMTSGHEASVIVEQSSRPATEDLIATMLSQLHVASPPDFSSTAHNSNDGVVLRYLDTFPGFESDHMAPLRQEIDRLAKTCGWGNKRIRQEFTSSVVHEFAYFQGHDENMLETWQRICTDLKVHPIPDTITQCKKALKNLYVNIEDYIDSKRAGVPVGPIFTSLKQFRIYTVQSQKIFPKTAAKQNNLLKILLERVFAYRS